MNKQLLSFNVMTAVKNQYAERKLSDSEFAKHLTTTLATDVSTARVRQARIALGIANNEPETPTLIEARALIAALLERVDPKNDSDWQVVNQARGMLGIPKE